MHDNLREAYDNLAQQESLTNRLLDIKHEDKITVDFGPRIRPFYEYFKSGDSITKKPNPYIAVRDTNTIFEIPANR